MSRSLLGVLYSAQHGSPCGRGVSQRPVLAGSSNLLKCRQRNPASEYQVTSLPAACCLLLSCLRLLCLICHAAILAVIVVSIDWLIRHQKSDYLSVLYGNVAPPPLPPLSLISSRCVSWLYSSDNRLHCGKIVTRFWLNVSVLWRLCTVITLIILTSLLSNSIGYARCAITSLALCSSSLFPPTWQKYFHVSAFSFMLLLINLVGEDNIAELQVRRTQ